MASFDVFISYAHADRERVVELREALQALSLDVWLDDREIETFESITGAIRSGLARSSVLLAFYSRSYPMKRACQWELTAAFVAAHRAGQDPRARVLVVNPEQGTAHIEPVELRDALFAAAPPPRDAGRLADLAAAVAAHVAGLDGLLGALGVGVRPPWRGRRPVGAARFVGRLRDMWAVHSALCTSEVGLITGAHGGDPALKVTGMGGIGKSLLALEYALRFGAAYPGGVFWLRAYGHDDRDGTVAAAAREAYRTSQLGGFATELQIATAELAPRQIVGAMAAELDRRGGAFLWIVDDLPSGLSTTELEDWYAPGRFGRTLMTSRSRDYGGVGAQIDLGVLGPEEGAELLAKHRWPDGAAEHKSARGLVSDLGGHALALDVAGAALHAERGVRSYAQYRAALEDPHRAELEVAASLAGELPGGHEASVATTLARSIMQLDEPGLDVLRLASVLAADPIPAGLVVSVFAGVDDLAAETAHARAVAGMRAAIARSLAEPTDGGSARRVHTLVSRTMRLLEPRSQRAQALADTAINTIIAQLQAATDDGGDVADALVLAHARYLAGSPLEARHARLLGLVATNDSFRGEYRLAQSEREQVLGAYLRLLGDKHPDTLAAFADLAASYEQTGRTAEAITLEERVLGDMERILGVEHLHTLTVRANLATSYSAAGRTADATALRERVLADMERVLGDQHPNTLTVRGSLAGSYAAAGRTGDAVDLQERVLADRERMFGYDHPGTLIVRADLAVLYSAAGRTADATGLEERVLADSERILGEEHPRTLTARGNLAASYAAAGRLAEAIDLQEGVLADSKRKLGDEHPDTLTARGSLAGSYALTRRMGDAIELKKRVLADSERILGDEHPDTLTARENLATSYALARRTEDAIELEELVLAARRSVLGDEHPATLTSMYILGAMLARHGDLADARKLLEETFASRQRVLGDEHPATLQSRKGLETILLALRDLVDLQRLREQARIASRTDARGDERRDRRRRWRK